MVFFARIRTAPKILAVVSIVAVVVAVVGVIGVRRIQGLSDTIGRLYQSEITALSSTKQAALNVLAIKEASARALVAEDSSEISFQRDVVATFDTEFVKALARAKPAVTDSAFAAKLTEAEHSYPAFLQGAHETINLAIARKHDAAVAKSTEVAAYGQAIADLLSEVSASREVLADAAFKDSRAQFVRSRSLLFALAGGGVLAALLLGFFVARVITRPLGETVRVLEAVAKGDLSQRLPVIGTDEVARMSAALNTAIDAQRLSLDTAERASQEAEESAAREREQARSLRERVEHLQVVMRAAADGDLTREVPIEGDDALAELASAFKHLITGLRGQIGTIGTDSALLTASSDEMAALSEELSSGAEETAAQARTVAEAARAVSVAINSLAAGATTVGRQLTAIEDSTAEASKVTQQASDLARGGSEMLAQLRTSSQKIGGVTEVIRNVAKQTNLLALNAAVEAARAGNAGLGFAVVAEEVRQLAGRTAEATTQISETVEGLQKDAAAATKTLAQITDVVSRVDALQRAVVAAVSEQAVTTGRMTASVNEVTTEAEKISVSIGDVAAGARTTSEGSAQLQSAAVQLTRLAGELDGFVKRFRIEDSASVGGRGGPAVPPSVRRVGRGTTSSPVPAF